MASHHLVDAELVAALDAMPPFHGLDAGTLGELRALVEAGAALQLESADLTGVAVETRHAPGHAEGDPPVRIVLYRPRDAQGALPAFLHLHGGGMVMGRPEMRHAGHAALARETGCLVASVDYRLAPETPFPGALHDAYAGLVWLHGEAGALGVDRARIAIGGESAGAGLAAALALYARDCAEVPVVAQMLTYPMLDDRTAAAGDLSPYAGEFVWGQSANRFGWSAHLGTAPGGGEVSPYAAPARAERLEGLPPAFIGVGALDLFLEENLDYARRLARAGTPTELHVYPGAFHAFDAVATAEVAQAFKADWRRALARAFRKT